MMTQVYKVGIYGASGYTGAELLRLCAGHPDLDVVLATAESRSGAGAADIYPSLVGAYPKLVFADADPAAAEGLDLVFLALPHGTSQRLVPDLRKRVSAVVDLAADFRLNDPSLYP
ncbi:MAG TPA: N-acetyl-gamma-glutamyl-phosphate reductase, partial [Acidimicrobiales bacterium]|nr:N-acetyl-gamma-glutamyl-phosphate reductase [Acidimicrobiales bacterium]